MMRLPGFLGRPSVTSLPPTPEGLRRNDWILFASVVLFMAAGWLLLRLTSEPQRSLSLGDGLPAVEYPAGWLLAEANDERLFAAINPATSSLFASSMEVASLAAAPGTTLDGARAALSLQRSQQLDRYRELSAQSESVLGAPALLVTYAWIADPTQDSGGNGLPVVVESQELIFAEGEGWARATVAADAVEFAREAPAFDRFFASLGLEGSAQ